MKRQKDLEKFRRYKARNPEKVRFNSFKSNLKKKGMTVEEFNQLFSDQGGCCAICGLHQTSFKKRLHVDHCHQTGKVRQLLCANCNHVLGKSKDSIEILRKAIEYLSRHR